MCTVLWVRGKKNPSAWSKRVLSGQRDHRQAYFLIILLYVRSTFPIISPYDPKKRVNKYHGKFKNIFHQRAVVEAEPACVASFTQNTHRSDHLPWPRNTSRSGLGLLSFYSSLLSTEYRVIDREAVTVTILLYI